MKFCKWPFLFALILFLIVACGRPSYRMSTVVTTVHKDLGITRSGPTMNGIRHGKWTTTNHSNGKKYHTWYYQGEQVTAAFFNNLK